MSSSTSLGKEGEQGAHRGRLRQRRGRLDDQLQRQRDQAQADQHAADPPDAGVLARREHHHAGEDQERREPGEVEREDHRHHRRCRRRRPASRPAPGRRRPGPLPTKLATIRQVAVADCTRLVTPSRRPGGEAVAEAAEDVAQVLAGHAQHAGANEVGAPHQQGDGGEQVEQVDRRLRAAPQALACSICEICAAAACSRAGTARPSVGPACAPPGR